MELSDSRALLSDVPGKPCKSSVATTQQGHNHCTLAVSVTSRACVHSKKGGGGLEKSDKDKLKVAGAAVAVAAALVFGGVKVYKVLHPESLLILGCQGLVLAGHQPLRHCLTPSL